RWDRGPRLKPKRRYRWDRGPRLKT
ncbi:hypothetical protein AZ016_005263, partial [Klebsiella pneumoniae]